MNDISYKEFLKIVKKVHGPRIHKVKNSWGIYDGFKYYRKNRPKKKEFVLTESQYFQITREINAMLMREITRGNEITFPCRMGLLELRKSTPKVIIRDDKLVNGNVIDWEATLKLWYEDEESYQNKTLVKMEKKEVFQIVYNKYNATYNNKTYYQFEPNRDLKRVLKLKIKEGVVDAFALKKKDYGVELC